METLSPRDRELVALGAALAAHCLPCVTLHVAKARQAGWSDGQIREALALADEVRQVPARAVLDAARRALADDATSGEPAPSARGCCA